jgi:cell division initiation protein
MDRIMPIDLERAQLKRSFRGYDIQQVTELLAGAAQSMQALLVENVSLRDHIEGQNKQLDQVKLQENTLKDAIILAQKAADETRAAAHQHAAAILEEARLSALAERVAGQQQISELRWEIERLKTEKHRFEEEFKAMLDRYQREITVVPILSLVEGNIAAVGG